MSVHVNSLAKALYFFAVTIKLLILIYSQRNGFIATKKVLEKKSVNSVITSWRINPDHNVLEVSPILKKSTSGTRPPLAI